MKKKQENKKLWTWTRVCFWLMVVLWLIPSEDLFLSLAFGGFTIATFVMSILHLKRYTQKGFAITALVISSLGVLLTGIGFVIGVMIGMTGVI